MGFNGCIRVGCHRVAYNDLVRRALLNCGTNGSQEPCAGPHVADHHERGRHEDQAYSVDGRRDLGSRLDAAGDRWAPPKPTHTSDPTPYGTPLPAPHNDKGSACRPAYCVLANRAKSNCDTMSRT